MFSHFYCINFFFFFNFTILCCFCHTSTWICHGIHVFPILNPPPTSLLIPSLWVIPVHQPQASCILHWTWSGNSFQIWYYTCFNAIPPNHPTLSLSLRVQKTVVYICVSFAGSHTGLLSSSFQIPYICVSMLYCGEGNGTPLQYSCLENSMDRGAWWTIVHGTAKSWTRLSDFTFAFHFHALEKEMATHSSVLAWRIPGIGEPGGLPSMRSHRVGHDWSNLAAAAYCIDVLLSGLLHSE